MDSFVIALEGAVIAASYGQHSGEFHAHVPVSRLIGDVK
jgi:hypothetical protein